MLGEGDAVLGVDEAGVGSAQGVGAQIALLDMREPLITLR